MGDNAQMSIVEFVDFNQVYNASKPISKKATRRSRRSKSSKVSETVNTPNDKKTDVVDNKKELDKKPHQLKSDNNSKEDSKRKKRG